MSEDQFLNRVIELLPALRAFGRSLCGDPARADDLVQDTFLRAWLNQNQFRFDSNLKAWLFTILANSYYSELRLAECEVCRARHENRGRWIGTRQERAGLARESLA